jgi:hypothetical protein
MAAKIGLMPFPSAMFVEDCIAGNVKLPDWD